MGARWNLEPLGDAAFSRGPLRCTDYSAFPPSRGEEAPA